MKTYLVTGGAGFIGNNFIRKILKNEQIFVLNLDKLTYAGNLNSIQDLLDNPRYSFIHGDIADQSLVMQLLVQYRPQVVVNFAAESHVDRSLDGPADFIQTNIVGTFNLLECCRRYWSELKGEERETFRFLQISTDEVYGSLGAEGYFTETTAYAPNSPYSASKASADHLVRAYYHSYGLPVLTTNCSNNYGPYQFPEKLIPVVILNALAGNPVPVYGTGNNTRDWLYVLDHCQAIMMVLEKGRPGEVYNIGGNCERTNLQLVQYICRLLDKLRPRPDGSSYLEQIDFVPDRPGHDFRYAIDATKIRTELGWYPQESFETGIMKTVLWYLDNLHWCKQLKDSSYYRQGLKRQAAPEKGDNDDK